MDESKINTADARAARREEWRQILAAQQTSGLTASAFCRERGISACKFWYWRKALLTSAAIEDGFVQMPTSATHEVTAQVWIEVGRWRVCVKSGFDAATLRRAVEALSAS